jgi:hypothetical protein
VTAPLRRYLLNKEISIEARRIAHFATKTCCRHDVHVLPADNDDEHTKNCNVLKRQIETLAMQIKLANLQQALSTIREQAHEKAEQEFAED